MTISSFVTRLAFLINENAKSVTQLLKGWSPVEGVSPTLVHHLCDDFRAVHRGL